MPTCDECGGEGHTRHSALCPRKRRRGDAGSSSKPIELVSDDEDTPFDQENTHQMAAPAPKPAVPKQPQRGAATAAEQAKTAAAEAAAAAATKAKADADAALLKQLECPVCLSTMMPPIRQCLNGHTVCSDCSISMDKCPICRVAGSPAIRNLALEQMAGALSIRCAHEGCTAIVPYAGMADHAKQCCLRPLPCVLPNCPHLLPVVTPAAYMAHLRAVHSATDRSTSADGFLRVTVMSDRPGLGRMFLGYAASWAPFIVAAPNGHFMLLVSRNDSVYKFSLWGLGVSGNVDFAVKGTGPSAGHSLSMTSVAADIFERRNVSMICDFSVPIAYAHWMSDTHEKDKHYLRLEMRVITIR